MIEMILLKFDHHLLYSKEDIENENECNNSKDDTIDDESTKEALNLSSSDAKNPLECVNNTMEQSKEATQDKPTKDAIEAESIDYVNKSYSEDSTKNVDVLEESSVMEESPANDILPESESLELDVIEEL